MTGAPAPDASARRPPAVRPVEWSTIPWDQAGATVRALQCRIAKAVREGKLRKAQSLQWLLTHSWSAKVLAVQRVTMNKGKRTPGVDGVTWTTPEAKLQAAQQLQRRGYRPQPLRRIYIPKKNGKLRPLGIPTMQDRAMQALHLLALAPVAETLADRNSYGFREYRGCADAIEQAFLCLAKPTSGTWVLEGDITACFDQISHAWLTSHVLMDRRILQQWLTAGYVWQGDLFPTIAGTPQGGICSPTLANLVLDGLEATIRQAANSPRVHFIRYADDFLVIARHQEMLSERVVPAITAFLATRGLTLSVEKTVITSIYEGVDFLGQHLRKYGKQQLKLLITPSKANVQRFLAYVQQYIDAAYHWTRAELVKGLNRKIRGWARYHRHICAKATFSYVDWRIYHMLVRRERRMNPKMGKRTIQRKYFEVGPYGSPRASDASSSTNAIRLLRAAQIPIVRHIKVRAAATPYDPTYDTYFAQRRRKVPRESHGEWVPGPPNLESTSGHNRGAQEQGASFEGLEPY